MAGRFGDGRRRVDRVGSSSAAGAGRGGRGKRTGDYDDALGVGGTSAVDARSYNNVWYTDQNGNGVGMVGFVDATTGAITRIATPSEFNDPYALTTGPDGAIWFTESFRNQLGRVVPSTQQVTEYTLPAGATAAYGITVGSDKALWFTEGGSSRIGRIDPQTLTITEFADTGSTNPGDIVGGPDGGVWFVDAQGLSQIDEVTHVVTHFPVIHCCGGWCSERTTTFGSWTACPTPFFGSVSRRARSRRFRCHIQPPPAISRPRQTATSGSPMAPSSSAGSIRFR